MFDITQSSMVLSDLWTIKLILQNVVNVGQVVELQLLLAFQINHISKENIPTAIHTRYIK